MPRDEARRGAAVVGPARAGDALGAGVEADARHLEEDVAVVGVDRDPLALAGSPQDISGPEVQRPFSRPAAASANETEPEQS